MVPREEFVDLKRKKKKKKTHRSNHANCKGLNVCVLTQFKC